MANSFKLAVVGGDGIGPEVTAEALKVLKAATPDVTWETTDYDLGARRYHKTGETLPETGPRGDQGARRDPARRDRRPVGAERRP